MQIQPSHDSLIHHRFQHDSVYILHEKTTQKGLTLMRSESSTTDFKDTPLALRVDTVILKHTEYRYRYLRDTVHISHTDTIPVVQVQEVIREVPSPIPRVYRYSMWFTILAIVFIIFYIVLRLYLRR